MKNNIYVTFDKAAERYNDRTFMAPTDTVAKRIICDSAENDKTFSKNAKDYDLFMVGEFLSEIGEIKENKKLIGNCYDILHKNDDKNE